MHVDERADLICVGSGAGGLSGAIVAAEGGAEVVVLEKSGLLGGVTARSQGQIWVGANHLADDLDLGDSREEAKRYLEFLSGEMVDEERQRAFLGDAIEAIRHLHDVSGLAIEVIRDCADYYYPQAPGSKPEGRYLEVEAFDLRELGELQDRVVVSPHGFAHFSTADMVRAGGDEKLLGEIIEDHVSRHEVLSGTGLGARLVQLAAARGVDLRVDSSVRRLLTDSRGSVVGVEVDTPAGARTIGAEAVLLATGGYDWNPEMVRSYEHLPGIRSMAQTTVEGDHIVMASRIGGMVASVPPVSNPIIVGFHTPGEQVDGHPVYRGLYNGPHSIVINRRGERFADESFYPATNAAMATFDGINDDYPNRPAWMIFDETFRRKYSVGATPPGQPLPPGTAEVGDTPAELAAKIGVDADGLERTIARFNKFCASGVDEDFGRGTVSWALKTWGDGRITPNPLLGPVDEPPFYGIELTHVGMGIPSAGLKIDTVGRVLDATDTPIRGLYAAGNSAARLEVGGYQSGIANARGLVFGLLAARDLLAAGQRSGRTEVA